MAPRHPSAPALAQVLEGRRIIPGNRLTLLVDGAATYDAMLAAIDGAERAILLSSYIFAADRTGARFRDTLANAARRGVSVRVIVDGIGSLAADEAFFAPLIAAGGRVGVFHPPKPWLPRWVFWRRDHRKILVVDDRTGFVGGLNIGDDYAPPAWGGHGWHDVHARIEGPAAAELTRLLSRTWSWLDRADTCELPRVPPPAGDTAVRLLENRLRQRFTIHRAYLHAIKRARERVRIANAYFVPVQAVQRALRRARQRGVQVQLLLAGRTDVKMVQYASRALYRRLLADGLEIYEWEEQVLHAKCAVVDGRWCSIGSYNFNRRSLFHDLETNLECVDEELGRALDAQLAADFGRARRVDPETWHRRPAIDKLLEQLFYKLRVFL